MKKINKYAPCANKTIVLPLLLIDEKPEKVLATNSFNPIYTQDDSTSTGREERLISIMFVEGLNDINTIWRLE